MKTLLFSTLLTLSMVLTSQAQFSSGKTLKTTPLNTGIKAASLSKIVTSKVDLHQIKAQTFHADLIKSPKVSFSPEELERNRIKSWELSPTKIYTPGMELGFSGNLDKNTFYLTPILNSTHRESYQMFNLSLICAMLPGKDYKLTFELANTDRIPPNSYFPFSSGLNQMIPISSGQKQVSILIANTVNAPQILSIGPYITNDNWQKPKSFEVTRILLEELAPAR
ncbi:hypothetical protein [Algoriphagus sp.]|uniref:hypothetical protein n=1 Tax=Algoriphagus sp. TaxID=1872435 RepID=UPI0026337AD9|nr:hypothetical protein [Algoriphagus sp.]